MTMQSQIRAHYEAQSLRMEKLDELSALARPRWDRVLLPAAVAAIVLVAVALASATADFTRAVGQEIANNHRRDLAPEFFSGDCATIAKRMDRLDFDLRMPERLADRGLRLVGARYCSVQGRIAAQLCLKDDAGRVHTLYVVRAFGRVRGTTTPHGPHPLRPGAARPKRASRRPGHAKSGRRAIPRLDHRRGGFRRRGRSRPARRRVRRRVGAACAAPAHSRLRCHVPRVRPSGRSIISCCGDCPRGTVPLSGVS